MPRIRRRSPQRRKFPKGAAAHLAFGRDFFRNGWGNELTSNQVELHHAVMAVASIFGLPATEGGS